jgi:hypothetical protein
MQGCHVASYRLEGFAAAICVDGGVGGLLVLGVALVPVQQREQLLPALPIHNLPQKVRALAETLASLCAETPLPQVRSFNHSTGSACILSDEDMQHKYPPTAPACQGNMSRLLLKLRVLEVQNCCAHL